MKRVYCACGCNMEPKPGNRFIHNHHRRQNEITRFYAQTRRESNGCLLWTGATNQKGYGVFRRASQRKNELAHRFAWELKYGAKASDCILHRCDNPPCVDWQHLFTGSKADNNKDMREKGRAAHRPKKLSDVQVEEIRVASGVRQTVLAKKYGVHPSLISRIIGGHAKAYL